MKPSLNPVLPTARMAAFHDADLDISRDWKPGSLNDDGNRGGTEKGFRK